MRSLWKKRLLQKVRIKIGKKGIMSVDMDLGFVPGEPCALTTCHVVISKQRDGSASG